MRMEMRLVESGRNNKVGYVKGKVINKKRVSRKKRQKKITKVAGMRLQRLYESCEQVFKGLATVPSPPDVQLLSHIIDCILPEDVGLSPELQFFDPSRSALNVVPRVAQTTIYDCKNFSICIFFLPAKAVIPLHNHPGMTVFSKLLLGTMHIKSYDWVDPIIINSDYNDSSQPLRLAKLKANDVFTAPCDTSVLYPQSGGNIHEFRAITPCAVLDVIGPPYSKEDDRDCSYYRGSPYTLLSGGGSMISEEEAKQYGWLEEIEMPKEAVMEGIHYLGPQINQLSASQF